MHRILDRIRVQMVVAEVMARVVAEEKARVEAEAQARLAVEGKLSEAEGLASELARALSVMTAHCEELERQHEEAISAGAPSTFKPSTPWSSTR